MWRKISIVFFFLITQLVLAQNRGPTERYFSVKIKIIDKASRKAITDAYITVNGVYQNRYSRNEEYTVTVKVNDELMVSHPNFETVYYTIKGGDEIRIEVEENKRDKKSKSLNKLNFSISKRKNNYTQYLDSAKFYEKKDIDKSLSFVEKALKENINRYQKADVLKTLATIYFYWQQYDLAIENYEASLKEVDDVSLRLQLAKTQFLYKKYQASELSYLQSLKGKLTAYETMSLYEGLGDVYTAMNQFSKAQLNYKSALTIAQNNSYRSKITDLNSKLAEVYAKSGDIKKADSLFKNSLELATKENVKRSLMEEEKVADFLNSARRYDEEIELRKESLKKAEKNTVEADDKESLVDSITSQKISYKIGNAYLQKEDYNQAIPYLEKSINEADKNEDLIVQKDATRKLSEVYETVGDYTKALKSYQEYVQLVDSLYVKKEQEIQQVKRFSKRISDNQNRIASLEKDKELAHSKIDLAYKDQQLIQENNKKQLIVIYSLLAGLVLFSLLVYFMYRNIRQQKLANNLLALKSMRSQMNPHFIFNALNSVNSFIAVNDERSANRYLSEFSVLMRSVLENSDEDFIPLSKEVELLQLYVRLEHNRFQDKFDYEIKVDEKILLDAYVIPPMLLQPYIENAIWHGLRYRKEKGLLLISMEQQEEEIVKITIEDNGIGRKKSMEMKTKNQLKQKSKGMSTIKNRIAILNDMYQDKIAVQVSNAFEDESGTKVELFLKKIRL
ncbi:tetratricopeptide repeat-containing sensor histidine kinase [Tenacibaculum sp. TC6]|uniref:tetratricopeptide repeat-containing sensor histidine kinase n=1 Tax=Tenacibaculum sp. TC6 TaxID=3423223 RepID=UPI003D36F9CE